jgi:L-ribulose-5-phosphate 3-epimerase
MSRPLDRRAFLGAGLALAAGPALLARGRPAPKLKKAVKFGMIRTPGSIEDKFNLIKKLGFQGVELDSPSKIDRDEAARARDKTGVVIHGVVDSIHWNVRLSDPDPDVRAKGFAGLKTALEDCKFYGGDTVLLVPGKVADPDNENYGQVWERSTVEVRRAVPLAEKLGLKIAVEVVWNDFLTKPEQLIEYVDQFKTPHVAAYFDCSNMVRYGVKPGEWIRKLGDRMAKFDFKGFSLTKYKDKQNPWVPIGEGDEDWPDVLRALEEVGYHGWATAEVAGGGEPELRDVADRMNRVLGLS